MFFLWLLLICVLGGLAFAGMATWLTTKRGNRISDVMNSAHFADAEAIKVEVLDKISVASAVPIVALYVVALACAVGPPAMYLWMNGYAVVTLTGALALPAEGHVAIDYSKMSIRPEGIVLDGSGRFQIPLLHTASEQDFLISSPSTLPITIAASFDPFRNTVRIDLSGTEIAEPEVETVQNQTIARLRPIHLAVAGPTPDARLANVPSAPQPVPASLQNAPTPSTKR